MGDACCGGGGGHSHGAPAATLNIEAPRDFETRADQINLSPVAAGKVKSLLEQEGRDDLALRISVQPGGCSGLRYSLYFDDRAMDGDIETVTDGVPVRVDRMSAPYLRGCRVDWLETLQQSGFTIDNPNVHGTCACGDSFH